MSSTTIPTLPIRLTVMMSPLAPNGSALASRSASLAAAPYTAAEERETAMAQGSCLCGEVAFEVGESLSDIELCHCRKCKKAYGAPFAATLYCKKDGFSWIRGRARVKTYDAPLEESPPAYRHCFCGRCGSALPLVWDDLPFVEVPVSSLDAA